VDVKESFPLTIDKIGPGGPKPGGISPAPEVERPKDASAPGKASFKEELKAAASAVTEDHLAAAVQQASARIAAGKITREQAIDFILSVYRKELIAGTSSPEEADRIIEYVREFIIDDPSISALLSGK
jgi:hypothetical protein